MDNRFPSVDIELPSRGWFYSEDNALSKGVVSIRHITSKQEDILTNRAYIANGTVLDKFLESIIVTPDIKYDTILSGDSDALIIASRILGYGKMYPVQVTCAACNTISSFEINLELLEPKQIEFPADKKNKNVFSFIMPKSGLNINFKLLTREDEKNIQSILNGYTKSNSQVVPQITTLMKRSIVDINGNVDKKFISDAVDNFLVLDSRAFRKYAASINPGMDWSYAFTCKNCSNVEKLEVEISETFFWPAI